MSFFEAVNAFNRIIDVPLNLNGHMFTIEELIIYFALGGILCFILGGLLR